MSPTRKPSVVEQCEKHQLRAVRAGLAIAIYYAASALEPYVGDSGERMLDILRVGMLGAIAILTIPAILWKVRNRPGSRDFFKFKEQGFVADIFRNAQAVSWLATLLVLLAFVLVAEETDRLSTAFYLNSALAVMFGVFSVVFLVRYRASADEDAEDDHA